MSMYIYSGPENPVGSSGDLPSWAPALNTVGQISSATPNSVNPGPGPWQPQEGFAPVMSAWGSGFYSPDYGTLGAYGFCGGGDADGFDNSIYLFLLDTGLFKRIAGPSPNVGFSYINAANLGFGEWPDGTPGMPHVYDCLVYLPPSMGGGPKGSALLTISPYWYGSDSAGVSHRCDLAAETWSRASYNGFGGGVKEGTWALDKFRSRIIGCTVGPSTAEAASIRAIGSFDSTGTGQFSTISISDDRLGQDATSEYMDSLDAWIMYGRDETVNWVLNGYDLAGAGVNQRYILTTTGDPLPQILGGAGLCYCPDLNCLFLRNPASGGEQFLWKIVPPSNNWQTAAWTVTKITMAGVAVGGFTQPGMWKRLRYVPKVGCVIWGTDVNHPIYAYRVFTPASSHTGPMQMSVNAVTFPNFTIQQVYGGCKHLDGAIYNGKWYQAAGDHTKIEPNTPDAQDGRQEIVSLDVANNVFLLAFPYYRRNAAAPDSESQVALPDDGSIAFRPPNQLWSFVSERVDSSSTALETGTARSNYGSDIVIQDMQSFGYLNIDTGIWTVLGNRFSPNEMRGDRHWRSFYDAVYDVFFLPCYTGNGLVWAIIDAKTGLDLTWRPDNVTAQNWGNLDVKVCGLAVDNRTAYLVDHQTAKLWKFDLDKVWNHDLSAGSFVLDIPNQFFPAGDQATFKICWHPQLRTVVMSLYNIYTYEVDTGVITQFPRVGYANSDNVWMYPSTIFYNPPTNEVVSIGSVDFDLGTKGTQYYRLTFSKS